jgi:hypothetical protein
VVFQRPSSPNNLNSILAFPTYLNHDMASPRLNDSSQSSEPELDPNNLSLDKLVDLFLASKRSLSCTHHVWRAREIVHTARDAVEDNAKVAARNSFVRYAVDVQLESLEAIRLGGSLIQSETRDEHDVGEILMGSKITCAHRYRMQSKPLMRPLLDLIVL